jgi:hypothetical protein
VLTFYSNFKANDHEVKFHKIKTRVFHEIKTTIRRSKFISFMRSKVSIIFHNFDQEVDTSIMRSKVVNNAFLSFDLMINLLVTRMIIRSKVANDTFLSFNLMNNLLAASGIMRLKLFKFINLYLWLIFSPNY